MLLERFKTAQDAPESGFDIALAELQLGRKVSHWIWYIFPQLAGLGRSSTAKFYGLRDREEAIAYLRDPVLEARLAAVTRTVAEQLTAGVPLTELMGGPMDAQKVVSSLTLFERVLTDAKAAQGAVEIAPFRANCTAVLDAAAHQGYPRCQYTLGQV
jgi:uncharacterized protein (DUF1810 family)